MSDLTFPPPNPENIELVAANRRLTTAILGMVLLTGLVACLAYLAGRTVTHMRGGSTATAPAPPTPVIVEPAIAKTLPTPPAVTPVAAPVAPPTTVTAPTAPAGSLYLQVGLMDPSRDRSMEQKLTRNGFQVRLIPMEEGSSISRVLVGPVLSPAQQREMETKLASEGFQYFPRRL